jgi:hypothetical protein
MIWRRVILNSAGYEELVKIVQDRKNDRTVEPAHLMAISGLMHAKNFYPPHSVELSEEQVKNYRAIGRAAFLPISQRARNGNQDNLTTAMAKYVEAMSMLDIDRDVEGLTLLD